ncbi:N-terminal C2 in EEIG1 and EHBP1 proteins-domain-containing protein [Phyllosticta citricarpa]|uniref:N-terminal C2 in EEIG1 and EHBP1 proteins-domain-containing protein n=2 Tax=Phyllosticta TaxID=121621 RepID=A0ABR1MEK8_9PEZI
MPPRRKTVAWANESLTALAVPKHRRPKFDLQLRIIDLNNVPLVSGTSFVKWYIPGSTAAEHRGRTERCAIKDHKVFYDYEKHIPVRLTIQNKTKLLEDSWIHFDVLQEYGSRGKHDRITLGKVELNLAEYVEASEHEADESEGVVRRYLMQESKINSTLKVGIYMRQIEGERDYIAPPLRVAQVFGGIAGIIAGEPGDSDDIGHIPTLSKNALENGEMQDMYRRTEIAFWAAQPGELRADECIEDIFSGGDGWGKEAQPESRDRLSTEGGETGSLGDGRSWHRSTPSQTSNKSQDVSKKMRAGLVHERGLSLGRSTAAVRGRASLEQQAHQMKANSQTPKGRSTHEVDELDVREDLRSWAIPTR